MKVLKFKLGGETAFFKKPDVNTFLYFTYSNIHKIALLGILGAIVGYKGYNQMKKDDIYPEFYQKLKDIKIAIEPEEKSRGSFSKKVQTFNNSVGYASQEQGGNLIVKEQWLEKPSWNIYILLDCEEAEKVFEYITSYRSTFIPYLGKNDHIANITDIEIYEEVTRECKIKNIHSLCPKSYVDFSDECDNEEEEIYKYQEKLPIMLNKITNMYEFETFIFTNMVVEGIKSDDIYRINNKNIVFY